MIIYFRMRVSGSYVHRQAYIRETDLGNMPKCLLEKMEILMKVEYLTAIIMEFVRLYGLTLMNNIHIKMEYL